MKKMFFKKILKISLGVTASILIIYNAIDIFRYSSTHGWSVDLLHHSKLVIICHVIVITTLTIVISKITSPIEYLVNQFKSVEYGKYLPCELVNSKEINPITEAFNEMLTRLEASYEQDKCDQEKLRQAEKLNAIGELAAATSHEIRNPLTSIKGFTQLIQLKCKKDKDLTKYTRVMISEISNIERIIKQFTLLARPAYPDLSREKIPDILEEVWPILTAKAKAGKFLIEKASAENVPICQVDREQIKQLLINIGVLAADNTRAGSVMRIATAYNIAENNIIISFEHMGSGAFYAEDSINMASSYRIVHNHSGTLLIKSINGIKTMYTIKLPIMLGDTCQKTQNVI